MGEVLDTVGHRSFGPILLLAGLVMVAPVVGDQDRLLKALT